MQNVFLKIDKDLEEDQTLWRYIDLAKFVSMVESNTLWLARTDTFKDKNEGRFPDEMMMILEKAYKGFSVDDPSPVNDAADFQDYIRKNTFVNCWHKNLVENMVMWEIYGRYNNALAIQTTVGNIKKSVNSSNLVGHSLLLKSVDYKRADEITGILLYEECVFIKRPHFSFEEEVRISLDTYLRDSPSKKTPYGYKLSVNTSTLIEKILVHPDSSDWYIGVIKSIAKKYEVLAPVERGVCGNLRPR